MDEEIRRKILALLDQHRIMTVATLRPDGWPPGDYGRLRERGPHALLPVRPRQPEGGEPDA
jgi:hypothetical protein